ncbi:MAG: magnesium and cobalt transport protein CorA [Propionibacteriaceae bacterium]|nr:magnesium and cobalt transport protein CorA [Propionibacteriaceae bacterium]
MAWGHYVEGVRQDVPDFDLAAGRATAGDGFVWLGLKDPSDEDMAGLAARFHLHPLAIEDAVEGHTRSKLEQFGDTLFCVISTVAYVDHAEVTDSSEIVSTGQIMVFVGEHFVMTVRRGEHAQLKDMRTNLENKPERLAHGTYEVLYAVLDKVIEDYLTVVSEFETDIEDVESAVFSRQGTNEVDQVYQLKRELIEFKRSVVPLGMPLHALATRPLAAIPVTAQAYFRELSDHHLEAREAIQSFDEVLTTILSAGLARASVADNQDMRKISAFVAIVAIPTMIAGIYGMNFENMPELQTRYGYFVVLGAMITIMLGLYLGFRRNKWL